MHRSHAGRTVLLPWCVGILLVLWLGVLTTLNWNWMGFSDVSCERKLVAVVRERDQRISELLGNMQRQIDKEGELVRRISNMQRAQNNLGVHLGRIQQHSTPEGHRQTRTDAIPSQTTTPMSSIGSDAASSAKSNRIWEVNAITREAAPAGIAVLIFCYNRPGALRTTLSEIFNIIPASGFPVFVSQDGDHADVTSVIRSIAAKPVYHLRFAMDDVEMRRTRGSDYKAQFRNYYRIAMHYGWAFRKMFDELGYDKVIVLEDDMLVAPDFFDYFSMAASLMDQDPSLYCASAWNDNGMGQFVDDPAALYRTDCFPGLGWLMTSRLWEEFSNIWPTGFWDDWMRLPEHRRGRSCLIPEVSRLYTFGEAGSSGGQFWSKFLKNVRLNRQKTDFESRDLSYLLGANFDTYLKERIDRGKNVSLPDALARLRSLPASSSVGDGRSGSDNVYPAVIVIRYKSLHEFDSIAGPIGLMTDHKSGVPRTSYKGVVSFRYGQEKIPAGGQEIVPAPDLPWHPTEVYGNGVRVFLVPQRGHNMASIPKYIPW